MSKRLPLLFFLWKRGLQSKTQGSPLFLASFFVESVVSLGPFEVHASKMMNQPNTPARRTLRFNHLADVMSEVDCLLAVGYTTVGRWTLGQVCQHMALGLRHSTEGFPTPTPWLLRRIVGPIAWRRISRTGRLPVGFKAPDYLTPKADLDDRAEAEALRAALSIVGKDSNYIAEHPVFGRFSHADWEHMHCIHCAHHLGFLLPEPTASS